jgi:outer membrane protein TolC
MWGLLLRTLAAWLLLVGAVRAEPVLPAIEPGSTLTLARAVELALAYQPARLAAEARADAARQRIGVARAGLLPQVWGVAQYLRSTNNGIGDAAFLGAPGIPRAPSKGEGVGSDQLGLSDTFDNYAAGLAAYQFLFDFGRRHGLVTQRDAEAEAEAARARLVELDVVYAVTVAYADLAAAREVVSVFERAVAQRGEQRHRADVRARADLAPEADVYTAEAELARAELSLVEAQNAAAVGAARLNSAIGLGSAAPDYKLETLASGGPSDTLAVYLERALAQRPDLRMFEEQARAAGAVISQARSDYWPTVGAVGGINTRGQEDTDANNYYVGVVLTWPLFDGLATDHEVAAARLQQAALGHDIQDLRLQIAEQVQRAYLDCGAAGERIALAERAAAAAAVQLKLADQRYANGLGSIIEVVEAERQSTDASALRVRASADLVGARAALARNTGERPPPASASP